MSTPNSTHLLLNVKESWDLVRVVNFSDSKVRNSVFSTVSMTVSYSSRTCRMKKSSWYGLEGGREGGREGGMFACNVQAVSSTYLSEMDAILSIEIFRFTTSMN